jgi:hypothetical protein
MVKTLGPGEFIEQQFTALCAELNSEQNYFAISLERLAISCTIADMFTTPHTFIMCESRILFYLLPRQKLTYLTN